MHSTASALRLLVDTPLQASDTEAVLQLSGKNDNDDSGVREPSSTGLVRLAELREGEHGVIDRLDLPEDMALRLMELGFIPGTTVTAARCAPGGDPRVFRVDGSEIALRSETASQMLLKI